MATIKSHTDLEQSKKLAEILPLDSADMQWFLEEDYSVVQIKEELQDWGGDCTVPCWSLASLLAILPDELEDNHFLTLDKEGKEYCCCYEDGNGNSFKHKFADNPVDACYKMILKLHELNLL